jgi:hypothetical protein
VPPFLRRFPVPVVFVVALCAASSIYAYVLDVAGRHTLVAWTATNLANLRTDPVGTLIASAFVAEDDLWVWAGLAVVGLVPITRRFGNLRTLLLIAAAHVIGTLVSEGILAWRIATGAAPAALRHLDDVGPSYVVTSALLATVLCGRAPWWWRLGALAGLLVLSLYIFEGLTRLDVAAVGHVVALTTGAVVGLVLLRRERGYAPDPLPVD